MDVKAVPKPAKPLRRSVIALAGTLGVLLAAATALFLASPALAAAACPVCLGFAKVQNGLYMERIATPRERAAASAVVALARHSVVAFYGDLESSPRMLVCATERCYRRFGGGGSRGMAVMNVALFLSPRGTNAVIATHELAHIELHTRIGIVRTWHRAIPQWFDEGLAVAISNDPRYLAPPGKADRCLIEPTRPMPTSLASWIARERNEQLYARAGCRVSRWLSVRGGRAAVLDLIDQVNRGVSFEAAFAERTPPGRVAAVQL